MEGALCISSFVQGAQLVFSATIHLHNLSGSLRRYLRNILWLGFISREKNLPVVRSYFLILYLYFIVTVLTHEVQCSGRSQIKKRKIIFFLKEG